MSTTPQTPQPGALENPMLNLGMLPRDVDATGWPQLPANEAVNFTVPAKAHVLKKGDTIYRVYGGGASMTGAYWSPAPPAPGSTEGDWRGANAVKLGWNAGAFVAEYMAPQDLTVWAGGVESQHAQDMNKQTLPHYWLVGGATQYYFPHWLLLKKFDPTSLGPTPWTSAPAPAPEAPAALVAAPGDFDPSNAHAGLAFQVNALAEALQISAEALRARAETAEAATALDVAVANLRGSANAILQNIGQDDDMVNAEVRSQTSLGCYISLDPETPGHETASTLMSDLILQAAALSGRA